jgi:hypothetical protein
LLKKEETSLENLTQGAFQGWLHSEEPLIFYFSGDQPELVNGDPFTTFAERLKEIQLPEGSALKLCILSMVSKNDCCTHCRPLVLEAMQHEDFLEKTIRVSLKLESEVILKKVLLYSGLNSFKPKRPIEGYVSHLDLSEEDPSALFLMAGNNPGSD